MYLKFYRHHIPAILVIFITFFLKFFLTVTVFKNGASLSVDEAQYWSWSKNLSWGYYSKPPMIAFFIRVFTVFLGESEIALKTIANICISITAWFVYLLSCRIEARNSTKTLLIFLTMPIAVFGSVIIATAAIMLLFWSIALYCLYRAKETGSIKFWIAVGVLVGGGMLSKYASIYFYLCLLIYFFFSRDDFNRNKYKALLAVAISFLVLVPNFLWNIDNGFVTFGHVVNDNISVQKRSYSFLSLIRFLGVQTLILGFVSFIIFVIGVFKGEGLSKNGKFLLSFSLPIFVLIAFQAFVNRANDNWAAPAFIALSLYVGFVVSRLKLKKLCVISIAFNMLLWVVFAVAYVTNEGLQERIEGVLYWKKASSEIKKDFCQNKEVYLFDNRSIAAEMNYYLRGCHSNIQFYGGEKVLNYFHQKYPYKNSGKYIYISHESENILQKEGYKVIRSLSYKDVKRKLYVKELGRNDR